MSETQLRQLNPIDTWALVELMGHISIAGKVSEETHFDTMLMRIDVPETAHSEALTYYVGGAALFRLTPCPEATARAWLADVPAYRARIENVIENGLSGYESRREEDIDNDVIDDVGDDDGLDEFGQERGPF